MSGEERRREIISYITSNKKPASGTVLAKLFQVSRQVIVQDMALLRAEGYEILSTNRGYFLSSPMEVSEIFYVCHDNSRIEEELNLIVDCGGNVQDVFVNHEVYGELRARLAVDSRKKAAAFCKDMGRGKCSPLNTITSGYHYHTVTAESQEILDSIEEELALGGFLVSQEIQAQ